MTLPSSGPISMSQISSELQGNADLGYYRGRQYWTPQGGQVTISQSPSFNEFHNLQLHAPAPALNRQILWTTDYQLGGDITVGYRPRTGELWVIGNNGCGIKSWGANNLVNPLYYQSLGINYSIQGGAGITGFTIQQGLACTNQDDYCIINIAGSTAGIIIAVDVTGNPK